MKKLLSLFLSVCIMGTMLVGITLPAAAATSGYYTYSVSDGEATITDCNTSISGNVTIPDTLGGYPVTSIGYAAFSHCSSLTSITIPDSVTSIGSSAFYNCSSLTSITIPDSVTSIGTWAFEYCSSLESITIPDSVTSIGDYAFWNCDSLTSITIPDSVTSIGDYAFRGCSSLTNITIPNSVTSIGDSAFSSCSSLTNITIPNSVTSIGSSAFYNCDNLTSIVIDSNNKYYDSRESCNAIIKTSTNTLLIGCKNTFIPNSVTSIGDYAFEGCRSLTSITIPDSVISIGNYAFEACRDLTSVTIGNGVTSIGSRIFSDCDNLTSIVIDSNNKYYDSRESCNAIIKTSTNTLLIGCKNTFIPNSVTSIGHNAFNGCTSLTSISIPDSVTSIKDLAFAACTNLTSITIPDSVTDIAYKAFSGCSSLTSITIPDSVTSIGDSTFYNCSSLTSITIPDSVTSIGNSAFSGCNKLTSITIPDSVTSIGSSAFSSCSSLTSITIPDSVTSIGSSAFSGCNKLTSITIPDSVTSIGYSAFSGCSSLTSINIPDGVTSIGYYTFSGCDSLTSITIPDSVTSIDSSAFSGCSSLTSITIPDSVTSIGSSAFSGCSSLTSITIPDSVTSIGSSAFNGCSSLKSIAYTGTQTQWNAISGRYNIPSRVEIYYNHSSHDYALTVTQPTFTTQGYTTHTCTVCGYSYKDNYTAVLNNVQNMQITATDTNIVVTWDAPENISKYNLYVKNENGETIITRALDADKTSVTLSWPNELEWDKNYTIGIRAKTTKWLDTVYKEASLVVGNRIVDVKTESVGRTIKVNWKAFDGATTYYVYVYKKGAYSEGAITSVKATTNTATIINAINPEIDYEVRVIATKGVPKMATADALSINARLNVFTPDTFTERGITPTKVGIGFDEVRGADKYWVYLTPVGGGAEIIKESTKAIAAVAGLAPNTAYTVQIQARITDADGKTHYSGKSAVLGTITTNDWEDINFTVTTTSSGAELTWDIPENAYSYIIYRSTNGGASYKKLATISDPAQTSYIDTKAKSGYKYAIVTQIQDDFVTAKSPLIKSAAI